jgi:hypothetical protein
MKLLAKMQAWSLIVLGRVMSKRRGRLLFANKKKQKNFFQLGRAGVAVTGSAKQKFFTPLFFKKAATFLFPLKPTMLQPSAIATFLRRLG